MSAVQARFNSGEISLSAGVAKTAIQIVAASNHRIKIPQIGVFLKGTVVTGTPVTVQVRRQTTAGTMTSGTVGTHVSKNNDSDDETLQTTVQVNATAEPTGGDILDELYIHPQGGYVELAPLAQEWIAKGGGRIGIVLTAPEAQTARVKGTVEE